MENAKPIPINSVGQFSSTCTPMPEEISAHAGKLREAFVDFELDPWVTATTAVDMAMAARHTIEEQRRRIAELEDLVMTDELTGLANRRGFLAALHRVLDSAGRYQEGGALAFVDVDAFKQVNDTHGHACGDAVLRKVGEVLTTNTRGSDVVARFGGDEFAVLLFRLNQTEALARVKQLHQLLNAAIARHGPKEIPIRASLGATPFGPEDDAEALLGRADDAMYRDKRDPGPRLKAVQDASPSEVMSMR